jgi:hypothetical protein
MPNGPKRDPIVNLKDLSPITSERQEQDPIGKANSDSRTSGGQLILDIFTAIRNRLDPTIRFVNHAT